MGLDMYLHAEKYHSQYDYKHDGSTMQRELNMAHYQLDISSGMAYLPTEGGITVSKCVLYWRKANSIHGWFVRELANGVDECQRINVTRDNLITLRDLCVNALANRDKASPTQTTGALVDNGSNDIASTIANLIEQEVIKSSVAVDDDPLAPTAGFFFGSDERDEYYYDELARTAESINSLLVEDDPTLEYYYQASW